MHGRERQGDAQGLEPRARLRRARSRGRADHARTRTRDPHPRPFQAHRQAAAAGRYARKDQRECQIRDRHAHPGHGLCGDRRLPGVRREAQRRGRIPGAGPARRAAGRQARGRGRGGRRPFLARQGGAGAAPTRMGRRCGRLDGPMVNARNTGDVDGAIAKSGKIVEALYEAPHLAHATMEPLNATVDLKPDRLDVWLGSQTPMGTIRQAAAASGLKPEQIVVHNCFLGGGFGRRSINDEMRQAILVAKQVGRPVKLVWTREEDMTHDRYRPQAAVRMRASLGDDGFPTSFDARIAVGSILRSTGISRVENGIETQAVEGIANIPYAIPNIRVGCMLKNTHVPVMFWRSVGSSQNAFFVESYVDELAHAAGQDPYRFRRALLAHRSDFLGVLDTIAEKSDWDRPLGPGRGRGIAIHECYGSIIGQVAEVTVSRKGELTVDRIVAAVDCGHVVNPGIVEAQIQSGVIYGLSAALYGEITIKDGRVEQTNFDQYQVVRLADAPRIEVHLALSGGKKWGGMGEPGTAATAPAVANAVFAATGVRVRALPLKNARLVGPA